MNRTTFTKYSNRLMLKGAKLPHGSVGQKEALNTSWASQFKNL